MRATVPEPPKTGASHCRGCLNCLVENFLKIARFFKPTIPKLVVIAGLGMITFSWSVTAQLINRCLKAMDIGSIETDWASMWIGLTLVVVGLIANHFGERATIRSPGGEMNLPVTAIANPDTHPVLTRFVLRNESRVEVAIDQAPESIKVNENYLEDLFGDLSANDFKELVQTPAGNKVLKALGMLKTSDQGHEETAS